MSPVVEDTDEFSQEHLTVSTTNDWIHCDLYFMNFTLALN